METAIHADSLIHQTLLPRDLSACLLMAAFFQYRLHASNRSATIHHHARET